MSESLPEAHRNISSVEAEWSQQQHETNERELQQQSAMIEPATKIHIEFDASCSVRTQPESDLPSSSSDERDDADSAASQAYYAWDDFQPSNWDIAMDVPTFGVATLALITALTHPVMFFAFLVGTAAGTAFGRQEGTFYDNWCIRNHPENSCWPSTSTAVDDEEETAAEQEPEARAASPLSTMSYQSATLERQTSPHQLEINNTFTSNIHYDHISNEWIGHFYPPLQNIVMEEHKFVGLNAVEFFRVFYSDNAPYSFVEFQKKRGDTDIDYRPWNEISHDGAHAHVLSLHPQADKALPHDLHFRSLQTRTVHFKAKTNSWMGPPYATTTKVQRMLLVSKGLCILESKTTLADIPFADRFFVIERWIIRATKEEGWYLATCSASSQVLFHKGGCPFEGQIRSKSNSTLRDIGRAWCTMATEALKLTEQTKRKRLQREEGDESMTDGTSLRTDEERMLQMDVTTFEESVTPSKVRRRSSFRTWVDYRACSARRVAARSNPGHPNNHTPPV